MSNQKTVRDELMNPLRTVIFVYMASRGGFVKCLLPMVKYREILNASTVKGVDNFYIRAMDCTTCDVYRIHLRDYGKQYGWRFEYEEGNEPDIYR